MQAALAVVLVAQAALASSHSEEQAAATHSPQLSRSDSASAQASRTAVDPAQQLASGAGQQQELSRRPQRAAAADAAEQSAAGSPEPSASDSSPPRKAAGAQPVPSQVSPRSAQLPSRASDGAADGCTAPAGLVQWLSSAQAHLRQSEEVSLLSVQKWCQISAVSVELVTGTTCCVKTPARQQISSGEKSASCNLQALSAASLGSPRMQT